MAKPKAPSQPLGKTLKEIKAPFWLANAQEACERLAYFGIRAVLPLMMVSVGTGGLGLSMSQKGSIYGIWAFIQCIVPMVSGGFSESFGYKKSLIVAFIINTIGYLIMANVLNIAALLSGSPDLNTMLNFWIMMISGCTIGLGTAIFKPPVQGIVAQSLNERTSSFGFGLFYWVVNIGGFLAPMLASSLRGNDDNPTWHYVFYGAAFVTLFNLLITILFFKEPKHKVDPNKKKESAGHVFVKTLKILWDDKKMLLFLLIISGFWLMFMQLWDLLPNFINEWVDRRSVGHFLKEIPFIGSLSWYEADGSLKPEMVINIDSAAIILFVLPLSALFSKYKMMTALKLGMFISVIGFIASGITMSGAFCCLAVFTFAIGEIICSPKFNEYIGMTAPADKKAIYMGYGNIPFAIGWAFGNILSGPLYDVFSSKLAIGRQWLAEHNVNAVPIKELDITNAQQFLIKTQNMSKDQLPQLIDTANKNLDQLKSLLSEHNLQLSNACQESLDKGVIEKIDDCQIAEIKNLLSNQDLSNLLNVIQQKNITEVPLDYCNMTCVNNQIQAIEKLSDSYQITEMLWNFSHPWIIWIILGSIGVISMIGMIRFYETSGMKEKDENPVEPNTENDDEDDEAENANPINNTEDADPVASIKDAVANDTANAEASENKENSDAKDTENADASENKENSDK